MTTQTSTAVAPVLASEEALLEKAAQILGVAQEELSLRKRVTSKQAAEITGISVKSIQRYASKSINARRPKLQGVERLGQQMFTIPLRSLLGLERGKSGRPESSL